MIKYFKYLLFIGFLISGTPAFADNIIVKNGQEEREYIKTTGAGTTGDPHVVHHLRDATTSSSATLSSAISIDDATSSTLVATNANRKYVAITVRLKDTWVKLQAASVDNDKKGIYVAEDHTYELPTDNIYTGEISGIGDQGDADIYVTEY